MHYHVSIAIHVPLHCCKIVIEKKKKEDFKVQFLVIIIIIIESVDSISRDEQGFPLTQYITNA